MTLLTAFWNEHNIVLGSESLMSVQNNFTGNIKEEKYGKKIFTAKNYAVGTYGEYKTIVNAEKSNTELRELLKNFVEKHTDIKP